MKELIQFDQWLFLLLNGLHHPVLDKLMFLISTRVVWIPLYAFLLFLIIKQYRQKSIYIIGGVILVVALADQSSVVLFKNVFERLRPCHEPLLSDMVHLVDGHCGGQYGFVSSHAANTFALATFIGAMLKPVRIYWPTILIIWAAVVSYSRIYLGVHYPGDVLCGGLLGVGIGILVIRFTHFINLRFNLNIELP